MLTARITGGPSSVCDRLATSRPLLLSPSSELLSPLREARGQCSSDEVANVSDVCRETSRPGKNYWKELLESLSM